MADISIIRVMTPEDKYPVKCPYIMSPIGITVHNTANSASAMAEISYMLRNDLETSFHFAVDENGAVQGLPLDRNGWHASDGNGTGNRQTVAVEIARSVSEDESLFAAAEENAAKLCAILCREYGWTTDDIYTHQHWDKRYSKYCPHKTLDLGWQRFLSMVRDYIDEADEEYLTEDTACAFGGSEEEKYISACYIEFLDRLPDPEGLNTYAAFLRDGGDPSDVDKSFLNSEEYKRNFIVKCYRIILGREPESEDVIREKMEHARLRDIFYEIYESEEAKMRNANET